MLVLGSKTEPTDFVTEQKPYYIMSPSFIGYIVAFYPVPTWCLVPRWNQMVVMLAKTVKH